MMNMVSVFEMRAQTNTTDRLDANVKYPNCTGTDSLLSNAVYYQYTKKLKKLNKIINQ